jgi:hypothetical protein
MSWALPTRHLTRRLSNAQSPSSEGLSSSPYESWFGDLLAETGQYFGWMSLRGRCRPGEDT